MFPSGAIGNSFIFPLHHCIHTPKTEKEQRAWTSKDDPLSIYDLLSLCLSTPTLFFLGGFAAVSTCPLNVLYYEYKE